MFTSTPVSQTPFLWEKFQNNINSKRGADISFFDCTLFRNTSYNFLILSSIIHLKKKITLKFPSKTKSKSTENYNRILEK
jgi:hypothetical protein